MVAAFCLLETELKWRAAKVEGEASSFIKEQLLESSFDPLPAPAEYGAWLGDLRPRTCLLLFWLARLGAVPPTNDAVSRKAHRFAGKRSLLGRLVDGTQGPTRDKVAHLIASDELDTYVAWLMWLRFQEYVPHRFVLPQGRERVLDWVRGQLRRPELTPTETLGELHWQIERLRSDWSDAWGDADEPKVWL